jgi:hypothetical protein
MVVFSVYENGYKQCSDTAMGTYITPAGYYAQGYINQKVQDAEDQGLEYEMPDAAQYAYCTPFESNQQQYYFQIGCADGNNQAFAVNIYEDDTCTTLSTVEGLDDANIDISAVMVRRCIPSSFMILQIASLTHRLPYLLHITRYQPTMKKCQQCVNWFDRSDDQPLDDGFYFSRMTDAPLCSTAWKYKETCDSKCQRLGMEKKSREGWSASDNVLLSILIAFGVIMVGLIVRKRQKMSNKDTLLEQASLSAAGLQQPHVLGMFALVVLVIAVFALLGLKNITWTLLLLIDTALFAYLMKLTIASSMNDAETIIGPDGALVRNDSDESSLVSDGRPSTYTLPIIA